MPWVSSIRDMATTIGKASAVQKFHSAQVVSFRASSQNPTVLPNAAVIVGGAGSTNNTISIDCSAATCTAGTASVLLYGSDVYGGKDRVQFTVTINGTLDA